MQQNYSNNFILSCVLEKLIVFIIVCGFEDKQFRVSTQRVSNSAIPGNSAGDLGAFVYPAAIKNNKMCGLFQSQKYDNFDWIRKSGSTPSFGTGPLRDKTHVNGNFCYANCTKKYEHNYLKGELPLS